MRWSEIFTNPQGKVIDFLLDHPKYDYSITEISQEANVSRPTLYKLLPSLVKQKLLRKKGRRYGLNTKNEWVKLLISIEF